MSVDICDDCSNGPLALRPFRRLMEGGEIICHTTREKIKLAMESGCAFCRLLCMADQTRWAAEGDGPRPNDVGFHLTICKESQTVGFHYNNPAGLQYLRIDPAGGVGRRYYLYAAEDDPSATGIMARTPLLEVGSPRAYELVSTSLINCIENHSKCMKLAPAQTLPTRVIDCEDPAHPTLFVSRGNTSPYVALSYVWGEAQPYCTRKSNVHSYSTHGINVSVLGQTIRDAIQVTHRLRLRYLWIDALCIIQDSDEDKANELAQMGNIYRYAYPTIIASSVTKASAGFLEARAPASKYAEHPSLPFHCRDGRVGSISVSTQDGPAEGLLLADAGGGRFRRIAYWTSFMQQFRRGDVECEDPLPPWFGPFQSGAGARIVELV